MKSAAVIQMVSGKNIDSNLESAYRWLCEAARQGASLAVLPENFAVFSVRQMAHAGLKEADPNGPVRRFLSETARELGIWIVGGTVPCSVRPDGSSAGGKVRAACRVYNSNGEEAARYDKIHLFDADVSAGERQYRESDTFEPGNMVAVTDTPVGRLGLAVCYDLRFSELFISLRRAGAEVISLPSAFVKETGDDHWEPLVRARAIETQTWFLAANQGGRHSKNQVTSGNTMVVDPWGRAANVLKKGEGVILHEIDHDLTGNVRSRMPVMNHRRNDLF